MHLSRTQGIQGRRRGRPAPLARRRGLTLIELLLVMGVLAFVMGVGAGLFAGFDPGQRAAVGLVRNLLRTAHNSAVARTAPARVTIDRETGTLVAEGMEVIGTWHFETPDFAGADGMDGVALGIDDTGLTLDGYQGRAVSFAGEPARSRVEFPIERDPIYDFELGFAIEVAVRLESWAAAPMIDVGEAVTLRTTQLGGLEVSFFAKTIDKLGQAVRGAKVVARTPNGVLRTGRWTRLRVVYDRRALRVLVDGVQRCERAEDASVWRVEGPLVLSGGRTPFPGALDSLVISAVTGAERASLPQGVRFTKETPEVIQFVAGGALDPALHRQPARLGLEFDDGRTEAIQVSLYGTVE